MKTFTYAWRYLWARPMGALLNVLLLTLGLPARELRGQAPGQRLHTQCLQHLRDTRAILSQTSGPIGQRQVVAHGERRA